MMHKEKRSGLKLRHLVEGLALLTLLLLILFALRGGSVGRAVSDDIPCKEGVKLSSCMTDSSGSYLVEMSCQGGKWSERMTKCDCQALPTGVACA